MSAPSNDTPFWLQLLERSEQVSHPESRSRLVAEAAKAFFAEQPEAREAPTFRERAEELYRLSQRTDDERERRHLLLLAAHYHHLALMPPD